jgi:tight adherence protein B
MMVFMLVVFFIIAFLRSITKKDIYQQRLNLIKENDGGTEQEKPKLKLKELAPDIIKNISKLFASRSFTENIQVQLIGAGIPLKGEEYITICLGFIILVPLLLWIISSNIWLCVGVFLVGIFVPQAYISRKKENRIHKLNQQLGDALIVMANALRAGFGFQQAMDTVRRELPPPIASEFTWTLREMNLGSGYEEALMNMAQRVASDDLDMVITGILIQRQVGGNLAEILDNISNTIRERAKIKGEIKILTAQGRLSGLVIGLLPVLLLFAMLIINPDYANVMLKDPRGMCLLGASIVMMLIGALIIKKIIKIDI